MPAAYRTDIFAGEFLRRARVDDLHIQVVEPGHHLFGGNRCCRIDLQLERDGRKLRSIAADRAAGGGPALDAFVVDSDVLTAEILQRVKAEIRLPGAATAVDDGLAMGVQSGRAEYLLNAVCRDEILGIVVA